MIERYLDGKGIAFADYRDLLPKRAADFPKRCVVKNAKLLTQLHGEWKHCIVCRAYGVNPPSWLTGFPRKLQLHHIAHGGSGRSDERTNLAMLCSHGPDMGCHSDVHGGKISLGQLLFIRWQAEPDSMDWVRLAILIGYFLPDLEST